MIPIYSTTVLYDNINMSVNLYSKTVEENWQLFKTGLLEKHYQICTTIRNHQNLPWINCDIVAWNKESVSIIMLKKLRLGCTLFSKR